MEARKPMRRTKDILNYTVMVEGKRRWMDLRGISGVESTRFEF